MKKILIIFACIILVILGALFIIPIAFKDQIKAAIDKAMTESINADVVWDSEDFSISLFTNFPNATAELNNFGIINRAPFEGEILFAVKELHVEVNTFSLFGDQIKIEGIVMNRPEVNIKVLADGRANYDITFPDSTTVEEEQDTTATKYNIGIDHWSITEGHIVYDDQSLVFRLELKNVQHNGSGDFTQDIFDLKTYTISDSVTVAYDGMEYIANKRLEADATISISDEYSRYTFKENTAHINDFPINFNGYLALLEDGSMDMEITYGSPESNFKSLLSLVPGVYTEDFNDITSEGTLAFNGAVKGKYDSLTMPAFNLALQINNGMFQYPDLPSAVKDIQMDLLVDNKDGVIENTVVDLKKFHMVFGNNPIDARMLIKNLRNYDMDAMVKGKLDLGEITAIVPMEGMTIKGAFDIDLKASGIYDSLQKIVPKVDVTMTLSNGYVKTADLPYALENLQVNANVKNETGKMNDFKALISNFSMVMDGEPFKANAAFENLDNYTWNLAVSGGIDLEKITKVFPMEGMTLTGKIKANIMTKGKMSDLEAERYDKLPTSGTVSVKDFRYKDAELPYVVTISTADASFDPKQMNIKEFKGTVGKSDMTITGAITNYIGYMFGDNQILKGQMDFTSTFLDLNEFMTEDDTVVPTTEEESYGVIEVPRNIDFILRSTIKTAKVMDMSMTNATGDIIIKDGLAKLSNLNFNLLGGSFAVNGTYDTRDMEKPKYDFKLGVKDLSIQKSFETFTIVQKFAPIAKNIGGNVSTDFNISGLLGQDMMPDLKTVSGKGLLNIAHATLENSKIIKGVTGLTKLEDTDKVTLKEVLMSATIEDGQLKVKPFDVNIGNYKTTIAGGTSLTGGLDYTLKMDVPVGKLGSQFNSFLSKGGASTNSDGTIPITIGVGGTYDSPTTKLIAGEQKEQAKEAVKSEVKDAAKDLVGNLLGGKSKTPKDSVSADSTKKEQDVKKKVEEAAKEKIKNIFKR